MPLSLNTKESSNLASSIHKTLTQSHHDWQYCYLKRGGDSGEVYLSARELLEASKDLATKLVDSVPEDSAVVLSLAQGPDLLISFLACIFAQRIVIPAPLPRFELNTMRLGSIFNAYDNAVILTKSQHFESIENVLQKEGNKHKRQMLCLDALRCLDSPNSIDLPGFHTHPESPIMIQFTSGSTSTPKGVLISSENVIANQNEVAKRWGFHVDKTYLTWLPFFHDMGLFGLMYTLMYGLKVVQMDPIHFVQKPQRWLLALSKFKAHISGGPAFAYDLCNELDLSKVPQNMDLANWEVAFCGADYVPTSTTSNFRAKYKAFNLNPHSVSPVYGLAETTLFVAGQPSPKHHSFKEYTGNLTEGCYLGEEDLPNILIRELEGKNILENGKVGEICIYGKSVSQGYYKHEQANQDGILQTGDLGFIEDNYLFICGRLKDIIVHNGLKTSPASIELISTSTNELLNPSAAAAFQTDLYAGGIALLIELKGSAKGQLSNLANLRSEIAKIVQQRTGISLSTIKFLKRGELMKTTSGKVQRKLVAENFKQGYVFKEVENA